MPLFQLDNNPSHLGKDIYGGIWDHFDRATSQDKELFAQIYPLLFFNESDDTKAEDCFRKLSEHQDSRYNSWHHYDDKKISLAQINRDLLDARLKRLGPLTILKSEVISSKAVKHISYHLAKSNPNTYKLREALDYYHSDLDISWTICKDAKDGDILFIGQSGKAAGIYAKACVVADATLEEVELDDDFFIDLAGARKRAHIAPIESLALMKHPILEHHLKAFPTLERVAKWLHCEGKCCHLSDEEGEALLRFV